MKQKPLTDFSDLIRLLPESLQREIMQQEKKPVKGGHDGKGKSVRVAVEKHGRKGKIVTLITGFQHNPATMQDIARTLKRYCSAGGTVKGKTIEIQGDCRDRVTRKLEEMNYVVS